MHAHRDLQRCFIWNETLPLPYPTWRSPRKILAVLSGPWRSLYFHLLRFVYHTWFLLKAHAVKLKIHFWEITFPFPLCFDCCLPQIQEVTLFHACSCRDALNASQEKWPLADGLQLGRPWVTLLFLRVSKEQALPRLSLQITNTTPSGTGKHPSHNKMASAKCSAGDRFDNTWYRLTQI